MIIKKFTGKNEIEATSEARRELGPNVVVMNVRTVKQKGLFYFLKAPLVEVTVALEEENERGGVRQMVKPEPPVPNEVKEALNQVNSIVTSDLKKEEKTEVKKDSAIEERLDSLQTLLERQISTPQPESKPVQETTPKTIKRVVET